MLPSIESIKQMRQKLGITQQKLATMAGVSTSMINQIESGRTSPSYKTAEKIFESLLRLEAESSAHTAGDFCSRKMVKIGPHETLDAAIQRMRDHSISQIPVFDGADVVGMVSEDGIVRHLADSGENMENARVSDMMDRVPPIVDLNTPVNVLVPLIRYSKCILVSERSHIMGIITASDALRMM